MTVWIIATEEAEARRDILSGPSYWYADENVARERANIFTADDKCDPRCAYKVYRVTLAIELEDDA